MTILKKFTAAAAVLAMFICTAWEGKCCAGTYTHENRTGKRNIFVSGIDGLNSAIASARPGDVIVMKNGVWHDAVINFNSDADSASPVTLRAQTSGKVILDGTSSLTFSNKYLTADGLCFKNGKVSHGSVISFKSDHCRLSNTAVIDYNPAEFETGYYWIYFKGSYNRLTECLLKGKNNMQPVIGNDNDNSRYNMVDHCYIKDIPYREDSNGREIMRIWGYGHEDQTGDDGAFFTIEFNLFDQAHGEGTEIISLKSNHNIVRYNTVHASRGGLVGRRGNCNIFEGNFIYGDNQPGTAGIRVAGQNQKVINNYICGVSEDAIRLIAGEYIVSSLTPDFRIFKSIKSSKGEEKLPKYSQVKNGIFSDNIIINIGGNGIDIGYNYKNRWSSTQMVLLPEDNLIRNNMIVNCAGRPVNIAEQDTLPPLDQFKFRSNSFEGNVVSGNAELAGLPAGISKSDVKLIADSRGVYWPDKKSSSTINKLRHPLTPDEVGPDWARAGSIKGSAAKAGRKK